MVAKGRSNKVSPPDTCSLLHGGNPERKADAWLEILLTLLDGTQFFLEIDVKRGSSHFFLYACEETGDTRITAEVLTSVTS